MNDMPETTPHLLSLLLGKRTAERVYRNSLADQPPLAIQKQQKSRHESRNVARWGKTNS